MEIVARQGFGDPMQFGPKAPTTIKALTRILAEDAWAMASRASPMFRRAPPAAEKPQAQARAPA